MAIVPEAQLIALVELGPDTPNSIAMLQLDAPPNTASASDGSTADSPPARYRPSCSSAYPMPPSARAHHRADAFAVFARRDRVAASSTAIRAATTENCPNRSSRLARFASR